MASTENMEKPEKERQTTMFQGKNIHSSPVDGKLLCSFSEKTCMQRRLNHFAFCIRHVLEDKNSPFKQCKFVAKYNGQRCTNAIPVKEERIYCNSHLQVLGIVPKKSRKKKSNDQNETNAQPTSKTTHTEIISCRTSQNCVVRRAERTVAVTGTSKPSPDERSLRKAKILSANPLLCELVDTYSRANSHRQDLLSYYGLCSSDEDSDKDSDDCKLEGSQHKSFKIVTTSQQSPNTEIHKYSPRAAKLQQLREKLCTELLGVKKSINTYNKDVKQSNRALNLLTTSAKSSPALTAIAIHDESKTSLSSSRKRSLPAKMDAIACTARSQGKAKCQKSAIPYTKYCSQHIINDSKQLLFHKCSADVSATSKCLTPTLDLLYEKPLCRDHAMGKKAFHPVPPPEQSTTPDNPVPTQKPLAKKPRRKPQMRASPTQKPVKPSRKATKKELPRMPKSEKLKKPVNPGLPVKEKQEVLLDSPVNRSTFEKSPQFMSENLVAQRSVHYLANGNTKIEPIPSPKNDLNVFGNGNFKEPEMFHSHEMDVDESLENEDLNMPEDLGDISPTGMLRDTVLKLPLDIPEPGGNTHHKQPLKSPIESFSMNPVREGNLHKPTMVANRVEPTRKTNLPPSAIKHYEITPRVNHMNILPGIRPSRSSVITLPKYPSNSTSLGASLTRHNAEFTSFTTIGPNMVKSEVAVRKPEARTIDVNHGPPIFPLSFDTVLNSWAGAGKLVLNSRARPLLLNSQMNPATFSPPSLSPHVSPQISLGTAFNFDRPSVLQHSNSPSPTLPFNPNLPNSPHGKLPPRMLRLEGRGSVNSASDMDPFFGATFDKS